MQFILSSIQNLKVRLAYILTIHRIIKHLILHHPNF